MEQLRLKSKIRDLRRKNALHDSFIPQSLFYSVMTEHAIRGALVNWSSYQREEVVQKVFQCGKKIFGILLLLGHTALLSKFIEADQLDTKLPFTAETLTHDVQLSNEEAEDFEERQWEFMAPTFCRGTLNRRLSDSAVLPFTQDKRIGKGAFGTVYETVLDPSHQGLDTTFPEKVLSSSPYAKFTRY